MLKKILSLLNWMLNPFHKKQGYQVLIKVTETDKAALDKIKQILTDNKFIFVVARDSLLHRGVITSEYTRKKNYQISVSLHHAKLERPERRTLLAVSIVNYYNGDISELRNDIDKLGETICAELFNFTARENISLYAQATELPMA